MITIGLTGSIGMGKTQVGQLFAKLGIPIIEADDIVHELYTTDAPLIAALENLFPAAIENGVVSRPKLADHLEKHPHHWAMLERLVHPAVRDKRMERAKDLSHHAEMVVFIIPLLFETGSERECDVTVVVSCPPDIQKQRLLARPGMNLKKLNALLQRQMPDALKRQKADFIIPTDEPLTQTEARVHEIVDAIRTRFRSS